MRPVFPKTREKERKKVRKKEPKDKPDPLAKNLGTAEISGWEICKRGMEKVER